MKWVKFEELTEADGADTESSTGNGLFVFWFSSVFLFFSSFHFCPGVVVTDEKGHRFVCWDQHKMAK